MRKLLRFIPFPGKSEEQQHKEYLDEQQHKEYLDRLERERYLGGDFKTHYFNDNVSESERDILRKLNMFLLWRSYNKDDERRRKAVREFEELMKLPEDVTSLELDNWYVHIPHDHPSRSRIDEFPYMSSFMHKTPIGEALGTHLGMLYYDDGEPERGLQLLQETATKYNSSRALVVLGTYLGQEKRFEEAKEALLKASQTSGREPEQFYVLLHEILGSVYEQLGDLQNALGAYQLVEQTDSYNLTALWGLSRIHTAMDNQELGASFEKRARAESSRRFWDPDGEGY